MIESSRLSKRDQKHSKILQKELEELHRVLLPYYVGSRGYESASQ